MERGEREIVSPGSNGVVGAEHHIVSVYRVELQGLGGGTEARLLVTQPYPRLDLLQDLHGTVCVRTVSSGEVC